MTPNRFTLRLDQTLARAVESLALAYDIERTLHERLLLQAGSVRRAPQHCLWRANS